MSILFGVRAADGESVAEEQLQRLAQATGRYATDGTFVLVRANVGMGFQPCYTHERSKLDAQPAVAARGNMLSFDGRLDNHEELRVELEMPHKSMPDSEIILAAFERWGESCFSRLVGDWALALWSNSDRVLYLARDHAGTRTLYYELAQGRVRWSTHLETFFVDSSGRDIDEVYAASYLAGLSIGELTPYEHVRAVPPAHFIRIEGQSISRKQHWSCWRARDEIRYRSDDDYEEHFFSLFKGAIRRRTGNGVPVVAQLSGGMDSSSIVCVSDVLQREASSSSDDLDQLIDTVSYYDDSEPGWDERPFFTAVEAVRGKPGMHFETSFANRTFSPLPGSVGRYMWPGSDSSSFAQEEALAHLLKGKGIRAVLSGLGGDELLGGVPTGTPELADLLVQGKFGVLCAQAFRWCLPTRTPLFYEIIDTGKSTWTAYSGSRQRRNIAPAWVSSQLKKSLRSRQPDSASISDRLRHPPSQIFAGEAWESILGSLPHLQPGILCRYEFRYPYLDRDLVDFLLAIPRTQLVRPGRRRFMMRNAMKGIVPDAVLERKRKASVQRSPLIAFLLHHQTLNELFSSPLVAEMDFVDLPLVHAALERVWSSNTTAEWPSLLRLINLEIWLRGYGEHGVNGT
jgi:asparagine synthase (glutamine-hydrolysing)